MAEVPIIWKWFADPINGLVSVICRPNQWTGFCMIGSSIMKELIINPFHANFASFLSRLFVWKIGNFDELQIPYFLLEICRCFLLNNVYKVVFEIFLLLFRSLVNSKIGFSECVETRSFLVFTNNSRSKEKIPNTFL